MRRRLAILLLAAIPLGGEAETVTYTWTPQTAGEAQALRLALVLHALREGVGNKGSIHQAGSGNLAALSQLGARNRGLILQSGRGHRGTLSQTGGGNAHALLQTGRRAESVIAQTGDEIGVTLQFGW